MIKPLTGFFFANDAYENSSPPREREERKRGEGERGRERERENMLQVLQEAIGEQFSPLRNG